MAHILYHMGQIIWQIKLNEIPRDQPPALGIYILTLWKISDSMILSQKISAFYYYRADQTRVCATKKGAEQKTMLSLETTKNASRWSKSSNVKNWKNPILNVHEFSKFLELQKKKIINFDYELFFLLFFGISVGLYLN